MQRGHMYASDCVGGVERRRCDYNTGICILRNMSVPKHLLAFSKRNLQNLTTLVSLSVLNP